MGWYGGYNNPKAILNEALEWRNHPEATYEIVDHSFTCYGKHLWFLTRNKKDGSYHITLYLLDRYKKNDWQYKPMDIDCHPYYYDCPKRMVEKIMDLTKLSDSGKAWIAKWNHLHNK